MSAHGGSASRAATFSSWTALRIARDRVQWSADSPPVPPAKAASKSTTKAASKTVAEAADKATAAKGAVSAAPSGWTLSEKVSAEKVRVSL